jgi:peptidoglycan/LPS O-acetylase OafA/YrhL
LGFVSYPLYLIHENAMISMIVKMPAYADWLAPFWYPLPAITVLALIAYGIARYIEPRCRKWLEHKISAVTKLSLKHQR